MRWVGVFLLSIGILLPSVLTFLLLNQGVDLWSLGTNVDGDGIGLHFLGIEINDRIPEANIPNYAIGFFTASAFSALFTVILVKKITKLTAKN